MGTKTMTPKNGPIRFPFNERKALAAATHLLVEGGGRMPYMRLLKLLYLADRASFLEYGRPITGDSYIAMKFGPVLSTVYDRIKQGEWGGRIRIDGYDAELVGVELTGPLSDADVVILDDVSRIFEKLDHWKISDLSHDLPEWIDTERNRVIPIERIFKALGKTGKEIVEAAEEAHEEAFFEEVFSDP